MQALVPAILLGMAGLDALDLDPEAKPPHRERTEPVERGRGGERHAVVGANRLRQSKIFERPLEDGDGVGGPPQPVNGLQGLVLEPAGRAAAAPPRAEAPPFPGAFPNGPSVKVRLGIHWPDRDRQLGSQANGRHREQVFHELTWSTRLCGRRFFRKSRHVSSSGSTRAIVPTEL